MKRRVTINQSVNHKCNSCPYLSIKGHRNVVENDNKVSVIDINYEILCLFKDGHECKRKVRGV